VTVLARPGGDLAEFGVGVPEFGYRLPPPFQAPSKKFETSRNRRSAALPWRDPEYYFARPPELLRPQRGQVPRENAAERHRRGVEVTCDEILVDTATGQGVDVVARLLGRRIGSAPVGFPVLPWRGIARASRV
jgi:hypothetical protein